MPRIVVPVKEEILRAAERRRATGVGEDIVEFLAELIDLGFEHRLQQLYRRFAAGEMSLVHSQDDFFCSRRKPKKTSNLGFVAKIACDKMNLTM